MSDRDEKRGGGGCAIGCALMLFFAPVLYVLSIGPVAWLVVNNESFQWVGMIYLPLGFLAEYCQPLHDAVKWYIELWTG